MSVDVKVSNWRVSVSQNLGKIVYHFLLDHISQIWQVKRLDWNSIQVH